MNCGLSIEVAMTPKYHIESSLSMRSDEFRKNGMWLESTTPTRDSMYDVDLGRIKAPVTVSLFLMQD